MSIAMADCPICQPGTCKGYPHLWRRMSEDLAAWIEVHEQINDRASLIPLAESLPLLHLVKLCPYRSRDADCGCTGHRCGLRSALVSHLDCLECVKRHGNA